jgi:hypothetical protein
MILAYLVMTALLALALCIPPVRLQAKENPAAMRKILLALSQSAKTLANATASGDLQVANNWHNGNQRCHGPFRSHFCTVTADPACFNN